MLKQEEDKTIPINFSRIDFGSYKRNNLTFLNILPSGKGEKEGGRQGDRLTPHVEIRPTTFPNEWKGISELICLMALASRQEFNIEA